MIANLDTVQQWVELLARIAVLAGGLIAGLWAYARLVVEKGLLPPSEFDVSCALVGERDGKRIVELGLHVENKGSAPLIVRDLRIDVRYAQDDEVALCGDPKSARFATLEFPRSLVADDLEFNGKILVAKPGSVLRTARESALVGADGAVVLAEDGALLHPEPAGQVHDARPAPTKARGLPLVRYDTFVQAQVRQTYTLVTALPAAATQVLVYGSFRYGARPSELQLGVLRVARALGLLQFSLAHVRAPHTAQRAFDLGRLAAEHAED